MIRQARPGDEAAILDFLEPYAATSMFLRSNLMSFGLDDMQNPTATHYLLYEVDGKINGVMGRANGGYLMCQCPDVPAYVWDEFANWLKGHLIVGITGEVAQVHHALKALGLPEERFGLIRTEPLYHLPLTELTDIEAEIRIPAADDVDQLTPWCRSYFVETGLEQDTPALDALSQKRAMSLVGNPDVRLLIEDGKPIAMAAINARAQQMVQVGGVFTPKENRGQGLAGRLISAHLKSLTADGVTDAVLFAASEKAARAYEKIGFQLIGSYQLALLKERQTYGGPV